MSFEKTLLLGFVAGVTIFLGLPIGRLRRPAANLRAMLNAIAVGILLFLIWDVLSQAWEPIDTALSDYHAGHGGLGDAVGYGLLLTAGLGIGLLGLVTYERWMDRRAHAQATLVDPETDDPMVLPEAGAVTQGSGGTVTAISSWSPARTSRIDGRRGYRAAQLRGRACDRTIFGEERSRTGNASGHRVRAAQCDRGFRDHCSPRGRDRRGR